ncbi:MAG: hypothetical protein J0H98_03265 [Solirubrobacterales bacterium]|nr:hypothetical protein [Solirubrobacterales bacterium]
MSARTINRGVLLAALLGLFASGLITTRAQASSDFVVDPSFGSHGLVTGPIGPVALSSQPGSRALVRDAQGRVIFGAASGPRWRVWRLLPNGSLDPSFGDQGEVEITRWRGYGASSANLTSAVIRPDGRILLVGFLGSVVVGNNVRKGDASMVLTQLMADGSPDLSFGQIDGGRYLGGLKGAVRVALQPDGGFVVGAFQQIFRNGRTDDGALFCFKADGTIDPDFGNGGEHLAGVTIPGAPGKPSNVFDVDVLPDGRIIVSGSVRGRLLVMKLNRDGSRDRSFGHKGQVSMLPGGRRATYIAVARSLEVDRKGRLVVAGFALPKDFEKQPEYGLVMRFRKNGRLDRSFGRAGIVRVYATPRRGERSTRLSDVTIDSRGGIWATGSAGRATGDQHHAIAVRFLPDGKRDRRFFKKGVMSIRLGRSSSSFETINSGRKIYMSGRYDRGNQERFFLKRLKPRG